MHRIPTVMDAVIVLTSTIATAATNVLLAQAPINEINYYAELRLLLIPLIGAMLVSGGMIMLNPQPETRRIVIGRSIFSLFVATLSPQLIGFMHPAIQAIVVKPVMLLAIGGATAAVVYAISKPFCAGLYERSRRIAKQELDRLEKLRQPVEEETITIIKKTPTKPSEDESKS